MVHALHPVLKDILTDEQWGAVMQAIFKQAVTDCQHTTRLRLRQKALEEGDESADDAHQEMRDTFEDQMQGAPAPEPKPAKKGSRFKVGRIAPAREGSGRANAYLAVARAREE